MKTKKYAELSENFMGMAGSSLSIQHVREQTRIAASNRDITVLIQGETGAGKELVANAIVAKSERDPRKYYTINCTAYPRELIDSILFGYKRGTFTGAAWTRHGIIRNAEGGTLFFDEIFELQPEIQAKLLRFIENGEVQTIGENNPVHVDVRIIATTNKNIEREIESGIIRGDLYYRLRRLTIYVPPLRERMDDIPELVYYLIKKHNPTNDVTVKNVEPEVLRDFAKHSWPGNVRELEGIIESALTLARYYSRGSTVSLGKEYFQAFYGSLPTTSSPVAVVHKPGEAHAPIGIPIALPEMLSSDGNSIVRVQVDTSYRGNRTLREVSKIGRVETERQVVLDTLNIVHWNRLEAAKMLRVSYKTLLRKIKEFRLDE